MYLYTLPEELRKNKDYWLHTIVPLLAFCRLPTRKKTDLIISL